MKKAANRVTARLGRGAACLEKRVYAALRGNPFFADIRKIGVAVSGGSDSMALFHLLFPWCRASGVEIVTLHFNHGLRGVASDGDELFVRQVCTGAGARFVAGRGRRLQESQHRRRDGSLLSLEMAAREARHAFFQRTARRLRLDAVAVAHHRDDAAETLLLRLARGSGATGLGGMKPAVSINGVNYVRPLLDFGRVELRRWLCAHGHTWREDATNDDMAMQRNLVRGRLLPAMRAAFGNGLDAALARSAKILREDDAVLADMAQAATAAAAVGARLALSALASRPLAIRRRVIYQWLLHNGGSVSAGFETVERILCRSGLGLEPVAAPPGGEAREHYGQTPQGRAQAASPCGGRWRICVPGGQEVRCESQMLSLTTVTRRRPPPKSDRRFLRRNGSVCFNGVTITLRQGTGVIRGHGLVGRLPACCSLCALALRGKRLAVRSWRPGDRIAPTGLAGSRKVQDVLTDAKVPHAERGTLPLLVCGDEVIWVPGYRVAARYAVPAADAASLVVEMGP